MLSLVTNRYVNPSNVFVNNALFQDGYYLAYKSWGTWVNWWTRDKPGVTGFVSTMTSATVSVKNPLLTLFQELQFNACYYRVFVKEGQS